MSIELPVEEVRDLGRVLAGRAAAAEEVRLRLVDDGDVDGPMGTAVARLLDGHAVLAAALAAELDALGAAVTGVADSWVALDAALLPGGPAR
ncbi:hypothetical protein [Blastococcus sp. SYSU D01042]